MTYATDRRAETAAFTDIDPITQAAVIASYDRWITAERIVKQGGWDGPEEGHVWTNTVRVEYRAIVAGENASPDVQRAQRAHEAVRWQGDEAELTALRALNAARAATWPAT